MSHAASDLPGSAKLKIQPLRYIDQLITELNQIEADYLAILEESTIVSTNLPPNYIGFAHWAWAPSSEDLQAKRMDLLGRLRDVEPRFLLLFPHPTPEVANRHQKAFKHLKRWLMRKGDDLSLPRSIADAINAIRAQIEVLRSGKNLLPAEPFSMHVVVDTNVLLDNPDSHPVRPPARPTLPSPSAARGPA